MVQALRHSAPAYSEGAGLARLAWLDYAKAFAIALVVFGHASRAVERTGGLVWGEGLQFADHLIYTFHIPLFFVLAGYAASLVGGRGLAAQARGLFWGVAVPYAVWTAVWVGLKVAFPGAVNMPASVGDLVTALWKPVEHMWFLQHLLIARVFWIAMEWAGLAKPGSIAGSVLVLALFGLAGVLGSTAEPRHAAAILSNVAFVGAGSIWIPVLMRRAGDIRLLFVAGVAAVAWLLLALQIGPDDLGWTSFAAALLAIFAVLVGVWKFPAPSGRTGRIVAFLGEASLAIYVLHSIVIAILRVLLQKSGALTEPFLIAAGSVLGLAVPALLYWLALALSARTRWPLVRYAGLGSATRSHYIPVDAAAGAAEAAAPVRL